MTLVRKIDGEWQPLAGIVTLTRMVSTFTARYEDGRPDEELPCTPYPVDTAPMDAGKIEQFVADGVWTQTDLDLWGLVQAESFTVPEGKQIVGAPRYVGKKAGRVVEEYDVEDVPPPPEPPTAEQKLALANLTTAEFDALILASLKRQAEGPV